MGNSLPPALSEVGTLIVPTSQERKKGRGKGVLLKITQLAGGRKGIRT